MMFNLKKVFFALVAVVAFSVPQLSAQQSVAAKYVDQDGFTYSVRNGGYMLRWFEEVYKVGTAKLVSDPQFAILDKVIREAWNESNASHCGFAAISGKEVGPDFYTVKQFSQLPIAERTGWLWKLLPDSPTVPFVDVMPKHTWAAYGFNFNGAALVAMADHYVAKFGNQQIKDGYTGFLAEGMQQGIDVKKIISSIEGAALYVEADPTRLVMPGFSSAALILAVKDRSLMDTVVQFAKAQNPGVVTAAGEILIPTDFGAVAVFQIGKYVVVTTDPAGVKNVISGKAPSLKQNPDYIKYSAGTPASGNSFFFISSELGKSVLPAYLPMLPAEISQVVDVAALCKVIGVGPAVYGVSSMNQDGYYMVINTGSKGLAIFFSDSAMGSVVSSGMMNLIGSPSVLNMFEADDFEEVVE